MGSIVEAAIYEYIGKFFLIFVVVPVGIMVLGYIICITVLPNSFGVPPDLSFPYLLQARGLPRYGFCALETPQALLIPIFLFAGSFFRLFCSSL